MDGTPQRPGGAIRRIVVIVVIGAFALAAAGGIFVLLGGDPGGTGWRVLATTALVGAFSVGVLCNAALIGRPAQAFGYGGAVVTVVAAALTIGMVWADGAPWDAFWRLLWTLVIASAASALAALLLAIDAGGRQAIRIGRAATLAALGVGVVLELVAIWVDAAYDDDAMPRIRGVVWILVALGSVTMIVLSLLVRGRPVASPATLSPAAADAIERAAADAGLTPDAFVARLLDGGAARDGVL
ncbi:hypothetical protein [Microbacterium gilvum]|uniref:Uncharacterized protein n=1 Tax=Microbacterium gilvum TaxID=1336204 RepID=A0ABP9A440_9MICO